MKFNIFRYNQRRAIAKGLDLKDLCILEWIQDFFPRMKKVVIDGEEYGWVNYQSLIKDIPIIEIETSDGLYRRLKGMVKIGLLKHKGIKNEMGSFSYYRITESIVELFDDAYPSGGKDEKSDGGTDEKHDGQDQKSDGADEKSGQVGMKSRNKDNPSKNSSIISSSSFITLEQAQKIAEEEDLKIDVSYWWKLSKASHEKTPIKNPKAAMIAWAHKPENQISTGDKMTPLAKSYEIIKKRDEILQELEAWARDQKLRDAAKSEANRFFDLVIVPGLEFVDGQFILTKEVPEKFGWICEKFNLRVR